MSGSINKPNRGKDTAVGTFSIVVGIIIGFFTFLHRPVTGLMDAAQRADTWVFKEAPYYGIMIFAGLLVLAGILRLVRGEKSSNISSGEVSSLDQIKKAKELLDSGAIDTAEFERIKKGLLDR